MTFSSLTSGAGFRLTSNGGTIGTFTVPNGAELILFLADAWNPVGSGATVAFTGTLTAALGTWVRQVTSDTGVEFGTRRFARMYTIRNSTGSEQTGTIIATYSGIAGATYQEHMGDVCRETAPVASPFGTIDQDAVIAATSITGAPPGTVTSAKYALTFAAKTTEANAFTANGEGGTIVTQLGGGANTRRIVVARNTTPDASPAPGFTWSGADEAAMLSILVEVTDNGGSAFAFIAGATLGAVVAAGTLTAIASSFAAGATLGAVVGGGTLGPAPGVLTSQPLRTNNGTLLASTSLDYVDVYLEASGVFVGRFTGLSTNGSGVFTVTSALLTPGTAYKLDWRTGAGHRRMPAATAA